jgi:hypothetical protein
LREQKAKEREEKWFIKAKGKHLTKVEWTTQRRIEKDDKTKFNEAQFTISIKVVGERFHNNFRASYWVHLLSYMGFGLGIPSTWQKKC